ncbi:MAG TPA: TatD family hydrolase [Anaeromyxobacteraceae bacterium]|nr:TatD family hydrolase [Anaeromyxobacteraceae bacterium]
MFIDSHAHLDFEDYEGDLAGVLARARSGGVDRIVLIGLWRAAGHFGRALELVSSEPEYFAATVGIHPHDCARVPEEDWRALQALSQDPRVIGVGETGLDFHYDHSPRSVQEASFRRSIGIAKSAQKPIVVHVREADEACARVLAEEGVPSSGGVIHCFTGDWTSAKRYLDLGLHLSVAGVVTFKSAEELRAVVKGVPRDRLLVETDSPYLAPIPYRGKRNEPAYVAQTVAKVAELWGLPLKKTADITAENARRLFRLNGGDAK